MATLLVLLCAAAPPAELVGWWSFGEGHEATVADRSGRGNDGRIELGERRGEGAGRCLELDGLGAAVVIPLRDTLGLTEAMTSALWARPDRLRNSTVLYGIPHRTESWTTPVFGMYLRDQRVVYGQWVGNDAKVLVESPEPLRHGAWAHLAATYDGATARLFINGAAVAEQPASGTLRFTGLPLMVGRGLGAKPSLRGGVAELQVYRRALSAAEVRALFETTRGERVLTAPATPADRDGTVPIDTHGSSPAGDRPWVSHATRLLELLDGFQPGPEVAVNRFGGRLDRPALAPAGFFRTALIDGRQWLIDPEGRLFYHIAINSVNPPRRADALFGSADAWAAAVVPRLRAIGFNGLGNWPSDRVLPLEPRLVWVRRHNFMFAFARKWDLVEPAAGTQGFRNRVMPVFHPDFEPFCEQYARDLASSAADPHLLGIMTDNELQCPVDLLDRCLDGDPAIEALRPNRDAARGWLAERGWNGDREALTVRDRYQFVAYAFERYYRIVTTAIRRVDPNHLYLGSRLNYASGQFDNPWFWRALAPYHDAVSVNYYHNWGPDPTHFTDWEEWAGKPILLTEWYAKAMDVPGLANTHGAGWLVRTQEDRGRFYQHFVLGALETPSIVGYHFFKYLDDPAASTALDSAGGANKGMFDVDGQPHAPLVARATAVNRQVYNLIDFFAARR